MNYREVTTTFSCQGERLVGIVAQPDEPGSTGVVVIVGGPQYRAGSHRQFVLLSRALAANGVAVLRFDYRGMGDSEGNLRDFEAVNQDVGAAIEALQAAVPQVEQVALWGLCDGASAALLYCGETADSRVVGLCLLNPWVRSEASLARTQVKHYYAQRLLQREFWLKLMRGGVAWKALTGLSSNVRVALAGAPRSGRNALDANFSDRGETPFQSRMAQSWNAFGGSICLILSGDDYTAKEFLEYLRREETWRRALNHPRLERQDLASADHTFSGRSDRLHVESLTNGWLSATFTSIP